MDRRKVYRSQLPYEIDVLASQQFAYEALGLAMLDILGSATIAGGFACAPTSPASLSVKVGPGRLYLLSVMDTAALGQIGGIGGLAADTNSDHSIIKQGILRDTQTFTITPPGTAGQSQVFLVQAQFLEADDAVTPTQFYDTDAPSSPISTPVSPYRRDKAVVTVKAGTAATTGTQTQPAPDAGNVALWAITVANGASTITAGNIAAASGSSFISSIGAIVSPVAAAASDIWAGSDNTKFLTSLAAKNAQAFQTLTDASTVAWNANLGFNAKVTLGGNRTIGTPTNLQEGETIALKLVQDGTGSRTATFSSAWDFGALGAPTLSTGAGKIDMVFGIVDDAVTPKIRATFWKAA